MAGDGWPDFTIPDVGNEGEPQASGSGDKGSPAPTAPVEPQQAEGTPPAVEGPKPGDENIPKYRFDEVSGQLATERETNRKLLAMLERFQPQEPKPNEEPDPEAERRQKILAQLKQYPDLAAAMELGQKADVINALIEETRARAEQDKKIWDAYAQRTLAGLHDAYAKAISGGKKAGKDLPKESQQALTDNFAAWIMKDPSGARVDRYNDRDDKLIGEFISDWQRQFVDPWRRQQAAEQVQQARKVANLPVGGGNSSPLGTPPPKPNESEDEDAVFHRGWLDTQQRKEQSS